MNTKELIVERLQETLGKMELALGTIREAIVWTDDTGKVQWCNSSFNLLAGSAHIMVLGKQLTELLPLQVSKEEHPFHIVRNRGFLGNSIYELRRNGTLLSLEISGNRERVRDAEHVLIFTIRDVTDLLESQRVIRKAKEDLEEKVRERTDQLLEISERYENIVREAVDAIITINDRGLVQSFNPAAEKIFGFCAKEMVGENVSRLMPTSVGAEHDRYLKRYLAKGEKRVIGVGREVVGIHKSGKEVPLYLALSEVRHRGEVFFTGILRDISDQKKAESALLAAKDEAESANRAKSAFLANMSHEIRTPMNAVLGFSDLLGSLVSDPDQLRYLDVIRSAGKGLLTIINDILDLSKIEAGKLDLHYESVDLRNLFAEVRQIFIPGLAGKELELKVVIDPSVPERVLLDEIRLRQVLINLVGNAVKFTGSGYVKLAAVSQVSIKQNHVDISVYVEDSGPGIDPSKQQAIFEAFSQQGGDYRTNSEGTGLGLAITRRLVRMMNGDISVESELGKGSIFSIELRDVEFTSAVEEVKEEESGQDIASLEFEPATVLVVDDVATNRELLKAMLARIGLEAIMAEDGENALSAIRESLPDAVLLDIRMPQMDGYEVLRRARIDEHISSTVMIAVTASVSVSERTHLDFAGFDSVLFKPVTTADLVRELSKFLPTETAKVVELASESMHEGQAEGEILELERLIDELAEMQGRFSRLTGAIELESMEKLAVRMAEIGRAHQAYHVLRYAEDLQSAVDQFSIGKIKELVAEFPTLQEKVASGKR